MFGRVGLRGGACRNTIAIVEKRGNAYNILPNSYRKCAPPWQTLAAAAAVGVCVTTISDRRTSLQAARSTKCEVASESGSSVSIVGISRDLSEAIEEASARVKAAASQAPGDRVKCFAPLIEKQRAILAAHGLKSFKDVAAKFELATAQEKEDPEVKRLALAEDSWRATLSSLEADANTDLTARLQIGDANPGFDLLEARSGSKVSLASLQAEGPSCIILVWLRHFG